MSMRVKSVDAASRKVKVDRESKYPVKRNRHSAHMQQVHAEKKNIKRATKGLVATMAPMRVLERMDICPQNPGLGLAQ